MRILSKRAPEHAPIGRLASSKGILYRAPANAVRSRSRGLPPLTHLDDRPRDPNNACSYSPTRSNAGHDTRALQAWLGHKNIQHTVRYTELAPDRFRDFWR